MVRVELVLLVCACGRIGFDVEQSESCGQPEMWFTDADGDGHGDPAAVIEACVQPPNTTTIGDDCDDTDRFRFPGAAEVCDGVDNDCNDATAEQCVQLCIPSQRTPPDGHRYLFCGGNDIWTNAQTSCAMQGYELATVDDAAENTYLAQTGTAFQSPQQWIGANDLAAEGTWVWPDGSVFWQGPATGAPVGGRFSSWQSLEPNNSDAMGENCAGLLPNGDWNDLACIAMRDFVCELD